MADPLDLEGLEAVARAATPGPWTLDEPDRTAWFGEVPVCDASQKYADTHWESPETALKNARYIATFNPSLVLSLITALRGGGEGSEASRASPSCPQMDTPTPAPSAAVTPAQAAYGALWRMMTANPYLKSARACLLTAIGGQGSEGQREAVAWAVRTFEPVSEAEVTRLQL
jgi:hypothetical protein